jgi:hypothetical protein
MQICIHEWLRVAGLAQIVLVIGSLIIPVILRWKIELAKVQTLIRQMFWTYAAYILVINLCFGLVSWFNFRELVNGSILSVYITGFIAMYWISRVLVQFLYFDRSSFPPGWWNRLGEIILVGLFIFLSGVYSFAFYFNYIQV